LSHEESVIRNRKHLPADLGNRLDVREDGHRFSGQDEFLEVESLGEQILIMIKDQVSWRSVAPVCPGFDDKVFFAGFQMRARDKVRKMMGDELIKFGKDVRKLAANPVQRQLDEARAEFKRRNQLRDSKNKRSQGS
jgi:hypothetical protein